MNPLLCTDVYKMGHMSLYAPGTSKVYSYLMARSDKTFQDVVFFGLQYYLEEYLSKPLTPSMGEDFLEVNRLILGETLPEVSEKIRKLCTLGYWPIKIKALPEGTVLPPKNALLTITNTLPDFYWTVGFVESMLLKVWYPITVASCVYKYRKLVEKYFDLTVDEEQNPLIDFTVHDFGYRSDSSEESAAVSGAAHLINFTGSDTVPALRFLEEYYGANPENIMASVPASEHSCMCSFGKEDEIEAFRNMLRKYPKGIISIVSDTYDIFEVCTRFMDELKDEILARDGKVVIRPDSGNPVDIICGREVAHGIVGESDLAFRSRMGCLRLLDEKFGSTTNSKGFKVLNPKIGLIYGDGMYYERYEAMLERMRIMGYASSNLVIGVGGILRNHTRDTLGFALKATYVEVDGQPREIWKDPVTDSGKKSHRGLISLTPYGDGFQTVDQCTPEIENCGLLHTVFENGEIKIRYGLDEIRQKVKSSLLEPQEV